MHGDLGRNWESYDIYKSYWFCIERNIVSICSIFNFWEKLKKWKYNFLIFCCLFVWYFSSQRFSRPTGCNLGPREYYYSDWRENIWTLQLDTKPPRRSSSPFSEKMLMVLVLRSAQSLHTRPIMGERGLSCSGWAAAADTGYPNNPASHTAHKHYDITHPWKRSPCRSFCPLKWQI